jgi:PhoH-like ATPase
MKKIYVLDTSVYLTSASAIYSYGNNDIVVPIKVLEELDKHKNRTDMVGQNARHIIRIFDDLRQRGSLEKGIRIGKGRGIVTVRYCQEAGKQLLNTYNLDCKVPDNLIIGAALEVKQENQKRKVVVVTRDIHMRVVCDSVGLQTETYDAQQVVNDSSELFTGFRDVLVDQEFIDQFYDGKEVYLDEVQAKNLVPNAFVMLVSNSAKNKTALARFISINEPLRKIRQSKRRDVFGVETRNREQTFAMDLLLDPKVPIVTLVGKAGSGKTLCAIAAGLSQVMEQSSTESIYRKLIVSRPVQPMGRDLGYLPGTMEEKMLPWLAPIQDNLQNLLSDKETLEDYMRRGVIEIEALTYIRGRSIANAFMIIDEAQNLSVHELKTIVTRVGENTKIVFTGDIEQIDNAYVNDTSNGLAYAVEKFKTAELAGHVTLQKGERSPVASLAAKIL